MKIDSSFHDGNLSISLFGDVDQVGAKELKQYFDKLSLSGVTHVRVDFTGVNYIGSAGVGKLLLLYKNLPSKDTPMELVGLSSSIKELFAEMELSEIFDLKS